VHPGAQLSGVPLGNAGDQIRVPSQSQRGRITADDHGDLPFQPERLHGFVDRSLVAVSSRDEDPGYLYNPPYPKDVYMVFDSKWCDKASSSIG
jgi:hypothetical protein